ncbi:Zn-ribbon domain-containing OB-fold protein [Saccharomonospora sp. NPDC046836]|uniref:Zn-ribbon domain-containing OB-fold protein n=1 Tax=Saccharomonospora sp. NPDC046836 TaxID=3156921 RepID=UPI003407789C
MTDYVKPLPEIGEVNRRFWEATREGRLELQRCTDCGHLRFPINDICPECLSRAHTWQPLSGDGEVFSYVVFHQVYNKAFVDDVPYNVALIQLDEGPRMFSNIVGTPNEQVSVGDRVRVVFDPVTDTVTLPRFELVKR